MLRSEEWMIEHGFSKVGTGHWVKRYYTGQARERLAKTPMASMQMGRMTRKAQIEVLKKLSGEGLERDVSFDQETGDLQYTGGYQKQRRIGEALGLQQTK